MKTWSTMEDYFRALERCLDCPGEDRERFLAQEELAQCFLEELDPELLERRKRRRKLGRRIFAGVVAAAMILLLVWVVLLETQPMKVEVTERLIIYEEREGPDET